MPWQPGDPPLEFRFGEPYFRWNVGTVDNGSRPPVVISAATPLTGTEDTAEARIIPYGAMRASCAGTADQVTARLRILLIVLDCHLAGFPPGPDRFVGTPSAFSVSAMDWKL